MIHTVIIMAVLIMEEGLSASSFDFSKSDLSNICKESRLKSVLNIQEIINSIIRAIIIHTALIRKNPFFLESFSLIFCGKFCFPVLL